MTRRELLKKTAVAVVGMPLMGKIALAADKSSLAEFRRAMKAALNEEFRLTPYANPPDRTDWWTEFTQEEFKGESIFACRVYARPRCTGYVFTIRRKIGESNVGIRESAAEAVDFISMWAFGSSSIKEEYQRRLLNGNYQGSVWVCGSGVGGSRRADTVKASISGDKRTIRGGSYWPMTVVGDGSCLSS